MALSCASLLLRLVHSHVRFLLPDRDRSRHIRAAAGHLHVVSTVAHALQNARAPKGYPVQEPIQAQAGSRAATAFLVEEIIDEEQLLPIWETNDGPTCALPLHWQTAHRARPDRQPQAKY